MNENLSNQPPPDDERPTVDLLESLREHGVIPLPDEQDDWLDTGTGPGFARSRLPGVSKGQAHKNVRVDPELWDRAKWIFETRGTTISTEIRDFLQRTVDTYEADQDGNTGPEES